MNHRPRLADLLRMNPAPGAHRVALRAGVSVGVPLLLCLALDRPEWTLYAAFGAFASLYGRHVVHASRAIGQVTAGVLLTAAVLLGAVVSEAGSAPWMVVGGTAVVALLGQLVSDHLHWHPPGPLFLAFGFGAVASAPPMADSLWVPVGVAGAAAAFAVLVGGVGAVVRRQRSPWVRPEPLRSLHSVRIAVAVVIAGTIAELTPLGHPYWAMVAVLATLAGSDHHARRARGWWRAGGTLLGLIPAAVLLALDLSPVAIVLVVIVLQFVTEVLVGRNYGLALLFITPLALLVGQLAVQRPAVDLLVDRGVETLIGVVVGMAMVSLEVSREERRRPDPS